MVTDMMLSVFSSRYCRDARVGEESWFLVPMCFSHQAPEAKVASLRLGSPSVQGPEAPSSQGHIACTSLWAASPDPTLGSFTVEGWLLCFYQAGLSQCGTCPWIAFLSLSDSSFGQVGRHGILLCVAYSGTPNGLYPGSPTSTTPQ